MLQNRWHPRCCGFPCSWEMPQQRTLPAAAHLEEVAAAGYQVVVLPDGARVGALRVDAHRLGRSLHRAATRPWGVPRFCRRRCCLIRQGTWNADSIQG